MKDYIKAVEKIIIKHYGKGSKFKTRGWEQCGVEIYNFIDKEVDRLRFKELPYAEMCDKIESLRKEIEGIYFSYFEGSPGLYNWVNGNDKLKKLINR